MVSWGVQAIVYLRQSSAIDSLSQCVCPLLSLNIITLSVGTTGPHQYVTFTRLQLIRPTVTVKMNYLLCGN